MKKLTLILTTLALSLNAGTFSTTEKIRVVDWKPLYKTVERSTPYQECYDVQVPKRNHHYSSSSDPFGTIIGGVAGGIIGNQVGKGRGKTIATIGGALVGSMVGHNLSRQDRYYETQYVYEKRCTTRYEKEFFEEFIGYKNIAYYKGEKIVKISPNKMNFIRLNKSIHY